MVFRQKSKNCGLEMLPDLPEGMGLVSRRGPTQTRFSEVHIAVAFFPWVLAVGEGKIQRSPDPEEELLLILPKPRLRSSGGEGEAGSTVRGVGRWAG